MSNIYPKKSSRSSPAHDRFFFITAKSSYSMFIRTSVHTCKSGHHAVYGYTDPKGDTKAGNGPTQLEQLRLQEQKQP